MGVIITILTVAIDPFSQQLVQLKQNIRYLEVIDGLYATSPYAYTYTLGEVEQVIESNSSDPEASLNTTVVARPHFSMQAAVMGSLTQPIDSINQQYTSRCPTSNCTWNPFNTLGVCHRCNDLTSDLRQVNNFTETFLGMTVRGNFSGTLWDLPRNGSQLVYEHLNTTAFSLPNGHFLPNLDGCFQYIEDSEDPLCPGSISQNGVSKLQMTSYGTGNPNNTNSMHDIDTLIWSMSIIQLEEFQSGSPRKEIAITSENGTVVQTRFEEPWDYWPKVPVRATECALYYCVKSLEPRVEGNVVSEAAIEVKGAKRDPRSWRRINVRIDDETPKNFTGNLESLEFSKTLKYLTRNSLAIHFPDHAEDQKYRIKPGAVWSISSIFQDSLREVWRGDEVLKHVREHYLPKASVIFNGWGQPEVLRPITMAGIWNRPSTNASTRFEAIATSMTNEIRTSLPLLNENTVGENFLPPESKTAKGKIGVQTTSYRIEWFWILLHGVILLGSIMFCVITTMLSSGRRLSDTESERDIPIWKNHSLASVMQGTNIAIADVLRGAKTIKDLEDMAKREAVTMTMSEKGPLVCGENEETNDDESSEQEPLGEVDQTSAVELPVYRRFTK